MESLSGLAYGFSIALTPGNLTFCFLGVLLGTLTGVLPGIGPAGALGLFLPVTFSLPPSTAIIMLGGIYYGAMYGGSTTPNLLNIPGEGASVITCLDGYQMAKKGRAGPALGMAAMGSYIAGTLGVVGLMIMAPSLADFALRFGTVDYVGIIVFGLTLLCYLGSGSTVKSFMMAAFGLLIGTIGVDPMTGLGRFTFGSMYLLDGLGLVPVVMGLFGVSEIFFNLGEKEFRTILVEKIKHLLPNLQDWIDSKWAILRGTVIGFFIGMLPGGTSTIASIMSYSVEKKFSKHPEKFGTGIIEGVAGPESANNSAAAGCFIPLLSLGIATNPVNALLLAALMIHGVLPGPLLIQQNPDIFWSVIASMYVGNVMLLILNLPLIGIWVQVLKIPYTFLFPFILLFCLLGSYSINNSVFDIGVMIFFGIVGFLLNKLKYQLAPFILAFVLGPLFEDNFRRSLVLSHGSLLIFIQKPIAAVFIIFSAFLLLSSIIKTVPKKLIKYSKRQRKMMEF